MKDENIHIKIELCKDKSSGKITLGVHFDEKAPNFKIENNECFWTPTNEEKNILNEAFDLVIAGMKYKTQSENNTKIDTSYTPPSVKVEPEIKTKPMGEVIQNPKETQEIEKQVFSKSEGIDKNTTSAKSIFEENAKKELDEIIKEKPKETEKIEKQVFGTKKEVAPSFEKDNIQIEPKSEVKSREMLKEEIIGGKDDSTFFEPKVDSVDTALEKLQDTYEDEDDNNIVEADEKTIIDRVFKQKKKGKWDKK